MKEILVTEYNPQPAVRQNAENAPDWIYKEEAVFLYRLAVIFRDRLVDPILRVDRNQVPDPVISFDDMRNNNILAAYTLNRNPQAGRVRSPLNAPFSEKQLPPSSTRR